MIGTASSTGLRLRRALRGLLLVAALLGPPLGTVRAAQGDDNGLVAETRYESPQFGYVIEWDRDWAADEAQTASDTNGDRLALANPTAGATVSFLGYANTVSARASLDFYVTSRGDEHPEAKIVAQDDAGDSPWTTLAYDLPPATGGDEQAVWETVAITVPADGVQVAIFFSAEPERYVAALAAAQQDISLDGTPLLAGMTAPEGAESSSEETSEQEEAPAGDEAPQTGTRSQTTAPQGRRDDEPEEPTDQAGDEAAIFASPDFGYTLSWDGDRWMLVGDRTSEGNERLELTDRTGRVVLYPYQPEEPTVPAVCVEGFANAFGNQPDAGERSDLTDDHGLPIIYHGRDRAYVAHRFVGGAAGDIVRYLECRSLEDGNLLVIMHEVPLAAYDAEQATAREELLTRLEVAADRSDELPGEAVPIIGAAQQHIAPGQEHAPYATTPPTFGPHFGNWAPWGVHREPIPDGNQIHNLEHGGVMLQYSCACPKVVELLETFADPVTGYPVLVIAAPYPDMEADVALTSWGWILELSEDEVTADVVREFIEAFVDRGPEKIQTAELAAWRIGDAPKP